MRGGRDEAGPAVDGRERGGRKDPSSKRLNIFKGI